jgi:hypothetical protein
MTMSVVTHEEIAFAFKKLKPVRVVHEALEPLAGTQDPDYYSVLSASGYRFEQIKTWTPGKNYGVDYEPRQ